MSRLILLSPSLRLKPVLSLLAFTADRLLVGFIGA
jgi:hypothetical protein